ncbi:caspase family protein [Candidatus Protochlamydia amoebophila]|nr:caspase family protein [Candidatus Protochlamydia amoebophila]
MKKNPSLYFILFLNLFCCGQMISAATLHTILVADTIHDINSITVPDLARWQKELQMIAQSTHMILKEITFEGKRFRKQLIIDYLKNFSVNHDDAVVFIFSGHGYRTRDKKSPWPFLIFELDKHGMDLKWIDETIRSKKPRFSLVLGDCCNNYIEKGFLGENKNIFVNLRLVETNPSGYNQLFCRAKGHIIVCSCSPGNFSYGSPFGGLYSQCFLVSLNREISQKFPSWKKVLERANGYIQQVQIPVCEINH